jgi:hypothetical protein
MRELGEIKGFQMLKHLDCPNSRAPLRECYAKLGLTDRWYESNFDLKRIRIGSIVCDRNPHSLLRGMGSKNGIGMQVG